MNTNAGQFEPLALLEALETFDKRIAPFGLYAAEEYQMQDRPRRRLEVEWEECLKPAMKRMKCNPLGQVRYDRKQASVSIRFQDSGPVCFLKVIRLSKIKVRRYGNAYRVDPRRDYSARWKEENLLGALNEIKKFHARPGGLLLFMGFADEPEPFCHEIAEVQSGTSFERRFTEATVKTWTDPHGRGFKVMTALWHVTRKVI